MKGLVQTMIIASPTHSLLVCMISLQFNIQNNLYVQNTVYCTTQYNAKRYLKDIIRINQNNPDLFAKSPKKDIKRNEEYPILIHIFVRKRLKKNNTDSIPAWQRPVMTMKLQMASLRPQHYM